jgi:hypothetical protein
MIPLNPGPVPNSTVNEQGVRMIPVELKPGVISELPEPMLFKRWGVEEDDRAQCQWIEYWLEAPTPDTPMSSRVHRSAHVFVKKSLELGGEQGTLNG